MNDLEKHYSSSMLPKIIIIEKSTKVKHEVNWCYKRLLYASVVQSQMIGLHKNNGSKITTWLLYMVILNKEVAKSSFNSSKKVEILTCSFFGSMNFAKQN
jgi:hypothetical protein